MLMFWNISFFSSFQLTDENVQMTNVYKLFNFNSGIVIVDNIAAIDHQTRNTLLKNKKNMLKIMEANHVDKILVIFDFGLLPI